MPARLSTATGDLAAAVSTIAAGATGLGTAVTPENCKVVGFIIGSTWAAAGLSWKVSTDGVTYYELKKAADGVAVAHVVAASGAYWVEPGMFDGWPYVIPRSGTAGAPVNQTGGATITILMSPRY